MYQNDHTVTPCRVADFGQTLLGFSSQSVGAGVFPGSFSAAAVGKNYSQQAEREWQCQAEAKERCTRLFPETMRHSLALSPFSGETPTSLGLLADSVEKLLNR
eukprot:scpid106396/ scgid8525/ 